MAGVFLNLKLSLSASASADEKEQIYSPHPCPAPLLTASPEMKAEILPKLMWEAGIKLLQKRSSDTVVSVVSSL